MQRNGQMDLVSRTFHMQIGEKGFNVEDGLEGPNL
jgi:hypothetical protein